ncbi:MAG: sigma-54-dependent Fis family transcriptional regulator [Treponema sp.]|nr:sigma-54-dependent Fis family transcriptional regulator [Candidatus Treponema equifaecale]
MRDFQGDGREVYVAPDFKSLKKLCEKYEVRAIYSNLRERAFDLRKFAESKSILLQYFSDRIELRELFGARQIFKFAEENNFCRKSESLSKLVGSSVAIQKLRQEIRQAAKRNSNVLIVGESGTGKELVARAIHELSERARHKLVSVNINEIPPSLFEASFFGYVKGAFTGADSAHEGYFAEADETTIFIDEIGDLSLDMQAKLLRVLQFREFAKVGSTVLQKSNFRLICASNANFHQLIHDGKFKNDLLQRLDILRINTPPLRNHRSDIPALIRSFLKENEAKNQEKRKFKPETIDFLKNSNWNRGNVRQLEACLERTLAMTDNEEISIKDLRF